MGQPWYFSRGGQQQGPVEWAELQTLAAGNKLQPSDSVWTEGFTDWMAASAIRDLFATPAPSAAAAPLPPFAATASAAQQIAAEIAPEIARVKPVVFPAVPYVNYAAIAGPQLDFAGFFMRFLASFIDGIIVIAMGFGLAAAFTWWVGEDVASANATTYGLFVRAVFVVVGWIYFASLESSPRQSTLGKRMLGLRVTDLSGNQISFARASVRHFGKILSQLILCIGYIMMKFTPNSQCLHDMISGCVVLKKEWN